MQPVFAGAGSYLYAVRLWVGAEYVDLHAHHLESRKMRSKTTRNLFSVLRFFYFCFYTSA